MIIDGGFERVKVNVSLPYYFEINKDTTVLALYFAN